ncbi:hypothetical protein HDE_12821 [Halotydeus destructor]|nr:hypothetical protein HDE_12821 [Halotydeus destructor]
MSTNSVSLLQLNDDIIRRALYFSHHIWDVLHVNATCQRLHSLSEYHMKTMRYVDLRLLCDPYLEDDGVIKDGIKRHLVTRIGRQLVELKLAKEHAQVISIDVLEMLQLLPRTLKSLVKEDEKSELAALLIRLGNDGKLVKKHQSLNITDKLAQILVDAVYKIDSSIIEFKNDSSTVERLNLSLSDEWFDVDVLVKCFELFPRSETR